MHYTLGLCIHNFKNSVYGKISQCVAYSNAITRQWPNTGLMLCQHRRRWTNRKHMELLRFGFGMSITIDKLLNYHELHHAYNKTPMSTDVYRYLKTRSHLPRNQVSFQRQKSFNPLAAKSFNWNFHSL